jgi:hypothetical protein
MKPEALSKLPLVIQHPVGKGGGITIPFQFPRSTQRVMDEAHKLGLKVRKFTKDGHYVVEITDPRRTTKSKRLILPP